ncbi:MAG: YceH family protein [Bacteroidia bacterium]
MDTDKKLPVLNEVELRVLGSLIEKSKITPDYYPMTLNGLTAACNQKTSRKPVVEYDENTVMHALDSLKGRSLVSTAVGGTSRTIKYKHNFTTVHPVSTAELAVLCLLFLRGPQTPGELNTNSARLYEFSSLEEVHDVLNKLINAPEPFVTMLPKRAGQKEARYAHLLGEQIYDDEAGKEEQSRPNDITVLEIRLAEVERELAEVKETLAKLVKELMG